VTNGSSRGRLVTTSCSDCSIVFPQRFLTLNFL
jgi:hypothetical protein